MMKAFKATAALLLLSTVSSALPQRDGRVISLFNVVTFQNNECQSTKDTSNKGTCWSSTECSDKGGSAEGNCAAGFGVCCVITLTKETGGDVSHNNTIIESKSYPTTYTPTAAATATYNVKPLNDDICFIRYDFIDFDTAVATTGVCSDTFAVTVPSNAGSNPPSVCGYNNGFHLYTDNMMSSSDTVVTITTTATAHTNRKWKIKIAQIGCDCPTKPSAGCHQYHLEPTGTIESWNHAATTPAMIVGQWTICLRQNKGKCGTNWAADPTLPTGVDGNFDLLSTVTTSATNMGFSDTANTGTNCDTIKMLFDGVTGTTVDKAGARQINGLYGYCGEFLTDREEGAADGLIVTKGFKAHVVNAIATDLKLSQGFKIVYTQTPC